MSDFKDIGITIGKNLLIAELRKQGQKLINQDENKTGKDDAAGRSLLAIASALEAIEFTDNPKSLANIGKALSAAGKTLQIEAKHAG